MLVLKYIHHLRITDTVMSERELLSSGDLLIAAQLFCICIAGQVLHLVYMMSELALVGKFLSLSSP